MAEDAEAQDDADDALAAAEGPQEAEDAAIDANLASNAAGANDLDNAQPVNAGQRFIDKTISGPAVGSATEAPAAQPATPAAGSADEEAAKLAEDRAAAIEDEGTAKQQAADRAEQEARDNQIDQLANEQAAKDARENFLAKVNEANDRVKNFKFHDHFNDEGVADRAREAVAVFLGGLSNLGGQNPGAQNAALQSLEHKVAMEHNDQLAYLNSAKYLADKAKEGYTDLLKQQQEDRHAAMLDYANKKDATAAFLEKQASAARNRQAVDTARIEAARYRKSAEDDRLKVQAETAKEAFEDARAKAALAKAAHRKGAGGGAGRGDAYQKFVDAVNAIPEGQPVPSNIGKLGIAAGIKPTAVQGEIDKIRASGGKSAKAAGFAPELQIIDSNGNPAGYASSSRNVKATQDRFIQYEDAVKSLEDLKAYVLANPVVGRAPVGDAYNRAVLAIAATTTANPSDATTKHEADTIKGALGTVSPEAIDKTLEHIKSRQAAFQRQLRHAPGDDVKAPGSDFAPGGPSPQVARAKSRLDSLGAVKIE